MDQNNMDEQVEDQSTSNATPTQVMDIAPPRPSDEIALAAPPPEDESEQPDEEAAPAAAEGSSSLASDEGDETSTDDTPKDNADVPTPVPPVIRQPKQKGPIFAILLAVIVAGALGVLSVMAYQKQNNKVASNTTNTQAAEEEVNTSDIDNTTTEIDKELNALDDDAEFQESDLTDDTLGL